MSKAQMESEAASSAPPDFSAHRQPYGELGMASTMQYPVTQQPMMHQMSGPHQQMPMQYIQVPMQQQAIGMLPMASLVQAQQKKEWGQDLCSCCSTPTICLFGWCCPSCLFCKNASDLGESPMSYCMLSMCLCMPMGIALRALAREKFQIQGSHADDVMVGICCDPCSECQIANEIRLDKIRTGGGISQQ